ncbi:MAG: hypothetical protein LAO06_04820 [Acidobacteriia bacterium]|nr:hypothetical protein [Terriglobia bacterium]
MKRTALWTAVLALALAGLPLWAQSSIKDQNAGYGNNPNPNPAYANNTIPEGTRFVVRLDDTLDTTRLKPGKRFTAKLGEDLTAPDGSTIPFGRKIHGHVSSINRGLHGSMLLSFDEIETRHGWRPLAATVSDVPGEHGAKATGEEGEVEKKGTSKQRVIEGTVAGAAIGATAGAVAAGAHGALIGAAAGGALGGTAGLLTDRDLRLNKGQQLELRLDRPLQVPR